MGRITQIDLLFVGETINHEIVRQLRIRLALLGFPTEDIPLRSPLGLQPLHLFRRPVMLMRIGGNQSRITVVMPS